MALFRREFCSCLGLDAEVPEEEHHEHDDHGHSHDPEHDALVEFLTVVFHGEEESFGRFSGF